MNLHKTSSTKRSMFLKCLVILFLLSYGKRCTSFEGAVDSVLENIVLIDDLIHSAEKNSMKLVNCAPFQVMILFFIRVAVVIFQGIVATIFRTRFIIFTGVDHEAR